MRVLRVVALVISLVLLLGAAWWGASAYVWHMMPVDSYTLVERGDSGQILRSISVHDAAKAEALRDSINNLQTSPTGLNCNTALWADPQFGFTLTFFNGSMVIETVTGGTYDCRGTIQVIGTPRVYVVGATYVLPVYP